MERIRRGIAAAAGLLAVLILLLVGAAAAQAQVTTEGYVPMQDGTELHYILTLPSATGRFPTLFTYDDYSAGSNGGALLTAAEGGAPTGAIGSNYVGDGYAYIGVNLPGTGCSTGVGNLGDVDTWGRDGAAVVEWIASQSWSDGHVGMVGASFQAMTQLGVAGFDPPHLDAIAPVSATTDFYRDIDYPGGIPNTWMTAYSGAAEPALTAPAAADGAEQGDTNCGAINPSTAPNNVLTNAPQSGIVGLEHPFFDSFWANDIEVRVPDIKLPVFGCLTWQDDAVSSRATEVYLTELPKATTWFEGNNGGHTDCEFPAGLLQKFYDHFVKGADNGFQSTPHTILGEESNGTTPAWYSYLDDWQSTVEPVRLYLHAGGLMNLAAPTGSEAADTYRYPTPSPSVADWQYATDVPGGSVAYTTPPLTQDAEFFGPGSLDFWLSSSQATDTDVQVTLSEVRPDGQEQYVARGWLRMSHRALDPALSTVLRPYQTDLQSDYAPLNPGQPTFARLELWPFDHVFRKGSSIRITFDTPTQHQVGGTGFIPLVTPTENTVYHDPDHVSSVALPLIPRLTAQAPLPACGNVSDEPCRANTETVPSGSLIIPETLGALATGGPAASTCTDARRFTFTLHGLPDQRVVSATVYINGARVRRIRGRDLTRLTIARLPMRTFVVRIVTVTTRANEVISVRTYRGCTKTRPRTHVVRSGARRR